MKLYTLSAIDKLINQYIASGGQLTELKEGSLGYGLIMLHGDNLKTAIVTERFLNDSSSGHSVRFYSEMPAKYKSKFGA